MIVTNKNEGRKIDYELDGKRLYFGDDELMVNLEKYQKDYTVEMDICRDRDGNLCMSTDNGLSYVAQVRIPAAEYEAGEPAEERMERGAESGMTPESEPPKRLPLDTDKVELILWAID